MPNCYLLVACGGSSLDQNSNNFSLFNLVEQVNVPPNTPPPDKGLIPLEIHAYWRVGTEEVGNDYEARFVLVAESGLETPSEIFKFRSITPRFRTRSFGMPIPPVIGAYELRVDWRQASNATWIRDESSWPVSLVEQQPQGVVTH